MKKNSLKLKNQLVYVAFVAPAVILCVICVLIPLIIGIGYSFRDWNGISATSNFIGLKNYMKLLHETSFLKTIKFTFEMTLIMVICYNVLALLIALALNSKIKLRGIYRSSFFIPVIIGTATVGYIWKFIIGTFFPYIGNLFHIEFLQKVWLADPKTAFLSLVIVGLWQSTGYYMIIYLTALQGVPLDMLEAASIDGASSIKKFIYVTLPLIWPSITICLFLSIVNCLKSFDLNFTLTTGGPYGSTKSIAYYIYTTAFSVNKLSYASALAIVFAVIIGIVAVLQVKMSKGKEVEL